MAKCLFPKRRQKKDKMCHHPPVSALYVDFIENRFLGSFLPKSSRQKRTAATAPAADPPTQKGTVTSHTNFPNLPATKILKYSENSPKKRSAKSQVLLSVNIWTAFLNGNKTLQMNYISPVFHIPIGTVVSVLRLVPIKKSPMSAGLSYTQDGNTGTG